MGVSRPTASPSAACPRCDARVEEDNRFCIRCGYALAQGIGAGRKDRPVAEATRCPGCDSSQVVTGDRFCIHCGAGIATTAPQRLGPSRGDQTSFACAHCQSPLLQGDRFCIMCGAPTRRGSSAVANLDASPLVADQRSHHPRVAVIAGGVILLAAGGFGAAWLAGVGGEADEPGAGAPLGVIAHDPTEGPLTAEDEAEAHVEAQSDMSDEPDEMIVPDPDEVDITTLVGDEVDVIDVFHAELTGTPPEEIIVHSQTLHTGGRGRIRVRAPHHHGLHLAIESVGQALRFNHA